MTEQNVDAEEIAKFEALAERWWDPESEFRPLHEINPLRVNFINELAPLRGLNVLDVGCGGGLLCEAMTKLGANVTGIDMAEGSLAVARLHAQKTGAAVRYVHSTAEAYAADHGGEFDVVTCLEMLEHVPEPADVVAACRALLKPGGKAFFSTINRNPKAYLFAVVGAEYVLNLLPRGTHDYAKFIKPSELETYGRANGLVIGAITGMQYNPLTKVYKLGDDVDVNYLIQFDLPADTA